MSCDRPTPDPVPSDAGQVLLPLARTAIAARLGVSSPRSPGCCSGWAGGSAWLRQHRACFVTLTQEGRLRGCVGTLEVSAALASAVRTAAVGAALRDARFPPVVAGELDRTRIEVSVLSPAEPMAFTDESDAVGRLRPGIDGVILYIDGRRATFLPQVWEKIPDPEHFIAQLKVKAGFPADYWDGGIRIERYRHRAWEEEP